MVHTHKCIKYITVLIVLIKGKITLSLNFRVDEKIKIPTLVIVIIKSGYMPILSNNTPNAMKKIPTQFLSLIFLNPPPMQ